MCEPQQIDIFPFALFDKIDFADKKSVDSKSASKPVEKLGRRSRRNRINEKYEDVQKVSNVDKNEDYEIITDNLVSSSNVSSFF